MVCVASLLSAIVPRIFPEWQGHSPLESRGLVVRFGHTVFVVVEEDESQEAGVRCPPRPNAN